MRGAGADSPVVAMRPGNAAERRGLVVLARWLSTAVTREEPVSEPKPEGKPFAISKRLVWEAWSRVKADRGAAGVDEESIQLSSGSFMPPPVRAVEIAKKGGRGVRTLGVPTVADRVAQTVVHLVSEPAVEPVFHADSYGYRPGRSALDAVGRCRQR
jgi:RNA-directed DNA polymerase